MGVPLARRTARAAFVLVALGLVLAGPWAEAQRPRRIAIVVVVGWKSSVRSFSLGELKKIYAGARSERSLIPLNRPPRSDIRAAMSIPSRADG